MDSKLLATMIAVAKKEAGAQARDLSAIEAEVKAKLKEFHKRSPILETPKFFVKGGHLHCKWQSGLVIDFGNIVGPQGPQGIQGPQGPKGDAGKAGRDGKDGVDGKDGRQGRDGKASAAGRDGVDGKDGERGPQGDRGEPGQPGLRGLPGRDGNDGSRGPQGLSGTDGVDGEDGVSVNKVWVDEDHHLKTLLSSGQVIDAGYVRGKPGASSGKGGRVTGGYSSGGGGGGGSAETKLQNPVFTYTSGALTSVAYTGGHTKVLAYNGDGTLNTVVTTINGQATTKTLAYNLDGSLASVTES